MALSNKQRAFVEAYLANGFNATKAAIAAGYSEKTAYSIGSENLRKPEISEAVKQRLAELTMSADEALMRLSQQARGTMEDFLDDNRSTIDLAAADRAAQLHLIKKFTHHIGEKHETVSIELYDAQAAQLAILKEQHLRAGEATERVDGMKLKAYIGFSPDEWDDEPGT
jgi:phage terminase small subunit